MRMGNLFRRNFGGTRLPARDIEHEKRAEKGKRMAREDKTINVQSIRNRKSLDFYGRAYSSLNSSQRKFINEKAYALIERGVKE